jgi:peptidoglycan/xylan/chitin deacetylase (PgdA/CDA1 family)
MPLVLLYHRIARLERDPWGIAVTPERFEAHLRVLKLFFRPVPLLTLLEAARAGRGKRMVSITFDDGYADLIDAERLLAKHRVPATMFVSSGPVVDGTGFWWDAIDRDDPRWRELKNLPEDERRRRLGGGYGDNRALTPAELQRLARSPWVAIGSHARSHSSLAALDRTAQEEEAVRSRREIEEIIGKPVTLFAYPFGNREDFSPTTVEVVRAAGYDYAFSGTPAPVRPDFDPYEVPRCEIVNDGALTFARRLMRYQKR